MDRKRKSPVFGADAWLYQSSLEEIDFVFAERHRMISKDGLSFDASYAKSRGWSVGLLPFDRHDEQELHLIKVFAAIQDLGVGALYGCAAIARELSEPRNPIDRRTFSPALVGKVPANMAGFISIRKSYIGIYSGAYCLFPKNLYFAILDINGHYTLIAGPRNFVETSVESPVMASWRSALEVDQFQSEYLKLLRDACKAYGYQSAGK